MRTEQPKIPVDRFLAIQESVQTLLLALGYKTEDPHFADTPKRVAKMMAETLNGNFIKKEEFLKRMTVFEEQKYKGIVAVRGVRFYSYCAHHMALFSGTFSLGYLPTDNKVLGLSKLVRIFRYGCKHLTTQEAITQGAADLLTEITKAPAICRVVSEHTCMSCRGVQAHGAETVTIAHTGLFASDRTAREEALRQITV